MSQSRRHSLLEVCCSTAFGYGVAVGSQSIVLPLLGVNVSVQTNMQIAAYMTVISIIRQYIFRRLFNHLQRRP